MRVWVHCPNCSRDYPKRFDVKLDVDPRDTHKFIRRQCPECKQYERLSIGGPIIREQGVDSDYSPAFADPDLNEYITPDTRIDCKSRHNWFVYALDCEWRQVADRQYTDWKYAAKKAYRRVYVGSTNDLSRRIFQHNTDGMENVLWGSEFTRYFRPNAFLEIHSAASEAQAREMEENKARELNRRPGWFVWQN